VCTHITWYCGGSFAVYSERCQVCHQYYECCRLKPWSLKAEQTLHGIYDPNTYIKASRIHLLHVYGTWIESIAKEEIVNHMIFCLHFLPLSVSVSLSLSLSHTHTHTHSWVEFSMMNRSRGVEDKEMKQISCTDMHAIVCEHFLHLH